MTDNSARFQQMIPRLGLMALVPFLVGVAAPWLFGAVGYQALSVFKLWSFTLLVFILAVMLGVQGQADSRRVSAQLLVTLMLSGLGIGAMLLSGTEGGLFAGVALLTFSHWVGWVWLQRTPSWQSCSGDFKKTTGRLFWVMLACHMLTLLNLVHLMRQPS